ncbi:MAG: hypothetical protein KDD14_01855 [Saprospiraceae bacterium]|nr:hypothetical protein [Saprospiraceae bacterium]
MNLNTHFVFDGKLKRNLFIGMGLGVLCLVWSAVGDDEYHTRFWSNYLHNAVFFTGIAFTAMFFLAAQITAFAGWIVAIKRVWEAMSQFMLIGLVLLLVIVAGVWGHFHHLYHWNTPGITDPGSPVYDEIIAGKSGFLSPVFFTIGTLGFLGIWYFWAYKMRQNSLAQDQNETASFDYYKKERKWAASFLPLGGFLSTVFLWELIMSVDPHWYSTMFAWYSTISLLLAGLALMVMMILYLQSKGYLEYVTREHLHDLGKYIFGISVFWMYLWFDQFMLIWYANVGEETIYFKERMENYPVLFWGNMLMNFVVPFIILMRNDTKRKIGTMFFVCLFVFFGHWWDFFYMIKPGARIAAHEAKELAEGKMTSHQEAAPINNTDNTAAVESGHAESSVAAEHGDAGHGEAHGENHESLTSFKAGFTIPGLQEIGVFIGFLSLFLFFFFRQLERAPLLPLKDPFLEESLHHSTGAHPEGEGGGHDH